MKRLLIDGYNLLNSSAFPVAGQLDLEGKREHLIRLLKSHAGRNRLEVILVFDNSQKPARQVTGNKHLKIIFTSPKKEADDVIKEMVRSEKSSADLTVVSSDLAIRFAAKDHGVSSLSSEEFCREMRADHQTPQPSKGKSNAPGSGNIPSAPTAKYDSQIAEDEVQFWKKLFEKGGGDE